jgi:hypothetical protein
MSNKQIGHLYYEFLGCHWHGHTCRPFRDLGTPSGDTLAERYERTMSRIEQIAKAGYKVTIQWECEFDESKIMDDKPELRTHPIIRHSPLKTRDALYGGRTEAMRVNYAIDERKETIEYCDVISLYPYICKYFKFPVGHRTVHVGDTCKNVDACLKMEGLIKCTVVPPNDLYHPVLPFRFNKKLYFCLCRSCVQEQNTSVECYHVTDDERAIEGTWVIDEVRLALEKGYRLKKIHEIYEYQVTRYNPDICDGGLFAEYINTFLKLKAEASGYPSWVRTPADEDRYIESFWQSEGGRLDTNNVRYNAGKRRLTKLCLNSMWGKLGERAFRSQITLIFDPQELYRFLATPGVEVSSLLFVKEQAVWISWLHSDERHAPTLKHANDVIASYVTAGARMHLSSI